VRDGDVPERAVRLDGVDRAPLGDPRDDEVGEAAQRLVGLERRRQHLADPRQEREPRLRLLRRAARVALRLVQTRPVERLGGLPREREQELLLVERDDPRLEEPERDRPDRSGGGDERHDDHRAVEPEPAVARDVAERWVALGKRGRRLAPDRRARSRDGGNRQAGIDRETAPRIQAARAKARLADDLHLPGRLVDERDDAAVGRGRGDALLDDHLGDLGDAGGTGDRGRDVLEPADPGVLFAQPLFRVLSRGDVDGHADEPVDRAVRVARDAPPALDPMDRSVGPDHAVFDAVLALPLERRLDRRDRGVAVVRVDQ
jgi:hypothetical protein